MLASRYASVLDQFSTKSVVAIKALYKSVWFFPFIVLMIFGVLVTFGINGSSIGAYNKYVQPGAKDPDLLYGSPRDIRSDEWLVTTPIIVSQWNDGFPNTNTSIGDGQNMNIILDVPTSSWFQIFRIQNWGFYILPLENAFSFKWFSLPVLLLISSYFFALTLLPRKRLFAALLSIALLASPFFNWWSLGSTTGTIGYCLLLLVAFTHFLRHKRHSTRIVLSLVFAYAAVSFALYSYPPFQIPCLLVTLFYILGLLFKDGWRMAVSHLKGSWAYMAAVAVASLGVVGLFLYSSLSTVEIIQASAYPGKRIVQSGGYTLSHLFSSNVAYKMQDDVLAANYKDTAVGAVNQSESSSFIMIGLLIAPLLIFTMFRYRSRPFVKSDIILLSSVFIALALLLAWMFVPNLSLLGSIFKLNAVPISRVIIGIGMLNFILLCFFIRIYSTGKVRFNEWGVAIHAAILLALMLLVNFAIATHNPGYLGMKQLVVTALILPIIAYLLSRRLFTTGLTMLVLFSIFCVATINPLYRGLGPLTDSPLYTSIKSTEAPGRWASEDSIFGGIVTASSVRAITGVYAYPQFSVWNGLKGSKNENTYNRYARVTISIDKNPNVAVATEPVLTSPDAFTLRTEPCSDFMKRKDVSNIITASPLPVNETGCVLGTKKVRIGERTLYLYHLDN